MNQTRVKYNAKARRSSATVKKKRKQANKTSDANNAAEHDPNAIIHIPRTKEEKKDNRKERLRQELIAASNTKLTSKRKKRLDKYIEKKLKKEERTAILQKLSQSQAELPSTLLLQASSTLGTGAPSTNKERLQKTEDKEVRQALRGRTGKRKRGGENLHTNRNSDSEDDEDEDESISFPGYDKTSFDATLPQPDETADTGTSMSESTVKTTIVGSALRRNADGTVVAPKLSVRKPRGKQTIFQSWKHERRSSVNDQALGDSDTSFDSSDSAYDSDEEGSEEDVDCDAVDSLEKVDDQSKATASKPKLRFKDWALKQLSTAKGYCIAAPDSTTTSSQINEPAASPLVLPAAKKRKIEIDPSKPREMRGPTGEDIQMPSTSFAQHLRDSIAVAVELNNGAVRVTRPHDVEEARLLLPIVTEEQQIMEAVLLNPVVIICGETGSGKTTQVPQFLYEAGYGNSEGVNPGMIGITQPRRVAAMSMASRVGYELSLTSSRVSYQIRYDATVSPTTSIKFMTDGVLLRELATDFLLNKYSVIIIDEAHERSINTDILIGVISRVVKLREKLWTEKKEGTRPLRLIIMSATLHIEEFTENKTLFASPPPVINISARQHPVTIHFSRRTTSDYVSEAIRKACKIHARLPPGGILIFLTGQNEITGVCRRLEAKYGRKALDEKRKRRSTQTRGLLQEYDEDAKDAKRVISSQVDAEPEECDLGIDPPEDLAADVDDVADDDPEALDSDDDDDNRMDDELGIDVDESDSPMHIVPLYSLLPSDKQMRVFQPPPLGSRLVVVSTNIAETSLTIPGIRYVVDSGRAKERRYDVANGIQAFQVSWVSKASAAQRAGRAGRTGPGHCYRLYSSALFEHYFDAFSKPEILRMPIEGIILQMKSLNIDTVVNFPFPTPPDRQILERAETVLTHLGALTVPSVPAVGASSIIGGQITDLGRAMSLFPLSPRFSKMLVTGRQHGCLPYLIAIVSALSVGDPFLHEEALENDQANDGDDELPHVRTSDVKAKEALRLRRKAFFQSQHTHASLGNYSSDIFRLLSVVGAYEIAGGTLQFCEEHFVRPKAMEEIRKLRAQINNIVQANFPDTNTGFLPNLGPPSELQLKILRQLVTAGFIDQVAARKDRLESSTGSQYATSRGVAYKALGVEEDVFIHPSSILADVKPPEYVVFNEIVRSSQVWLKGVTVVNPNWLSTLGKPTLCTFSKPVKNNSGTMMVVPKFGPSGWELPPVKAEVQR